MRGWTETTRPDHTTLSLPALILSICPFTDTPLCHFSFQMPAFTSVKFKGRIQILEFNDESAALSLGKKAYIQFRHNSYWNIAGFKNQVEMI